MSTKSTEITRNIENGDGLEFLVGKKLKKLNLTIATAESCTGGLIASMITDVSGSSQYFEQGVISYSNDSKIELLGVTKKCLIQNGAVSEQTASAMASGIRSLAKTDLGLGVTGIAGPTGGTTEKPIGLVYISLASPEGINVCQHHFKGSRKEIKLMTAYAALKMLLEYMDDK